MFFVRYELKLKKQLSINHIIQNRTTRWQKIYDAKFWFALKHRKESTDKRDRGIERGDNSRRCKDKEQREKKKICKSKAKQSHYRP
jgi:hypothetical protein